MSVLSRIGFMQGRLSPLVDGKIQAFPVGCWREEFAAAQRIGLDLMEWTLDQEGLYENPLLTSDGQEEIKTLMVSYGIRINSVTGDCFMQAPFWKADPAARSALVKDFSVVIDACAQVGIKYVVIPLVDGGRIENSFQKDILFSVLNDMVETLRGYGVRIVFEADLEPKELAAFVSEMDDTLFGINYDIGNSAAAGFNPIEEIDSYGDRIWNVHVKDRLLNGTTVELGSGNADFIRVFRALAGCEYKGNYILQTARATDGNHVGTLRKYRDMVVQWLQETTVERAGIDVT